MKVHGACHCGAVAWEGEVDPARAALCHCLDCQILSGAAFRVSVAAAPADLVFTRGAPKIYVKTAESGNKRAQGFCGDCGTPIYAADPQAPVVYMLRVGPLAERAELPPVREVWSHAALPWTADAFPFPKTQKQ